MHPDVTFPRAVSAHPDVSLPGTAFGHPDVTLPGAVSIHPYIPLLCIIIMLLFFSVQDLRKKAVSVKWAVIFAAAEGALYVLLNRHSLPECLPGTALSLLPGVFLYLFSLASGGGIGSGDAIVLLLAGILLSAGEVMTLLLTGLMFSAFYAAFLLFRGKRRQTSYPFIPFLLPGAMLLWFFRFS